MLVIHNDEVINTFLNNILILNVNYHPLKGRWFLRT